MRRFGCFALLLVGALALHQWITWPNVAELVDSNPTTTAFIESYRAQVGTNAEVDWRWVPYAAISNNFKRAVLVAEDIDFFDHDGFAFGEMRNAVEETLTEGRALRGASTLSQQLVKNLWLSPSRNPWRKVREALLTVQLERNLDKHRILELYLNVAELGPGIFGAEAAAQRNFGRPAARLKPRQSAELASCLPRPSRCRPGGGSDERLKQIERIERQVKTARWLEQLL